MRRIVIAPSFDAEFFEISRRIEQMFGPGAADAFEARFQQLARTLAETPTLGRRTHGYPTPLFAFVMAPNWIFYRFTDEEVQFLHIRDGRREKETQSFS